MGGACQSLLELRLDTGEVAEWPNVPDSKSGVPQGTVGSNPTLSASYACKLLINKSFLLYHSSTIKATIKAAVNFTAAFLLLIIIRGGVR